MNMPTPAKRLTWAYADDFCKKQGAELASFHVQKDAGDIFKALIA